MAAAALKIAACRWMTLALFGVVLQAHGDWLSLCHGRPASILRQQDDRRIAHYLTPDENVSILRLSAERAEDTCDQLELGISAKEVAWAGFAPRLAEGTASVALQGNEREQRFRVSEVILPESAGGSSEAIAEKPPASTPTTRAGPPTRSAWLWSPAFWLESPDRVFEIKSRFGLDRIYLSVPMVQGEVGHPDELRQFLQKAHAQGLQVWAVLGDPRALLNEGAERFISTSTAYAAFNQAGTPTARLDGLQLDIEPYLLPGYQQDTAAWLAKYSRVVTSIHQAATGLPLDIVLPFWFSPETPQIGSLLSAVKDSVNRITVMDYRTDPTQIKRVAKQFLAWGARNGKAIDIALETLPMEPEERRHYRRAEVGELWRLQLAGNTVLLLLNDARRPESGMTGYRYTHSRPIDGTDISFFKDSGRFQSLLPSLQEEFRAWPSFSGLAIHGLDHW